jgi:hypothetical protein
MPYDIDLNDADFRNSPRPTHILITGWDGPETIGVIPITRAPERDADEQTEKEKE